MPFVTLLQQLVEEPCRIEHDPEQLTLVFKETASENGSFAGAGCRTSEPRYRATAAPARPIA